MKKKIAIVLGSDSDLNVMKKTINTLKDFDLDYEIRIISAHRTPEIASSFARDAEENGFGVIIAAAGMAAHLAGVLAANTILPVIGVPIKSTLDGVDSLFATVQMPPGVPVATVAIDGSINAAILAVQILALENMDLKEKLKEYKKNLEEKVIAKDIKLQKEVF